MSRHGEAGELAVRRRPRGLPPGAARKRETGRARGGERGGGPLLELGAAAEGFPTPRHPAHRLQELRRAAGGGGGREAVAEAGVVGREGGGVLGVGGVEPAAAAEEPVAGGAAGGGGGLSARVCGGD